MIEAALIARWSLLVVTALMLQVGIAPEFPVLGVVANLLLLVAVAGGVVGGAERGAIVGFFCGLLMDLARGSGALGLSALAYTLVAAAVGATMTQVLQMRRLPTMGIVAGGSALGNLLFAVEGQLFGERTLANPRLWTIVVVSALVNGALSPLVLRVAAWAERRPEEPKVLGAVDV